MDENGLEGIDGWSTWGRYVLKELKRQNEFDDKLDSRIIEMHVLLSGIKSGMDNHLNMHEQIIETGKSTWMKTGVIFAVLGVVVALAIGVVGLIK